MATGTPGVAEGWVPGMAEQQDMKVVVLGDIGVGKTSLIRRYVDDEYVPDYRITVDLDFWQKKLRLSPDRHLNLQVVLGGEMVKWWRVSSGAWCRCGTCRGTSGSGGRAA